MTKEGKGEHIKFLYFNIWVSYLVSLDTEHVKSPKLNLYFRLLCWRPWQELTFSKMKCSLCLYVYSYRFTSDYMFISPVPTLMLGALPRKIIPFVFILVLKAFSHGQKPLPPDVQNGGGREGQCVQLFPI